MDLGLKGKVALVTGAGSQIGYGKGIVLALAKEGCDIIASDKDIKGAEQTAAAVRALGCKAIAIKADVAKMAEVQAMVKTGLKEFGVIDILVNNAGVANSPRPFLETNETEWEMIVNVNLMGVVYCTKAVLGQMVSRKAGKIINISSCGAKSGAASLAVYGAAKGGVVVFTKSLASELAALGINVNSVAPGPGNTGFANNAPPEFVEMVSKMIPMGKTTTPEDIGNMVTFLASDVASDITGQIISVDGGITMY
jgi:3-oxoacyl-[acyl-carrier protein] reductase